MITNQKVSDWNALNTLGYAGPEKASSTSIHSPVVQSAEASVTTKPPGSQIRLICEFPGAEKDFLVLNTDNRRNLNQLVFKDTRGRTRLSMTEEPLLSNLNGPAIIYPDGEEEYFINGHEASMDLLPWGEKFSIEYDASETDSVLSNDEDYEAAEFRLGLCSVTELCDEDQHSWVVTLESADEESDREIHVIVHMDDVDLDILFGNPWDLEPEEYFHTMHFAHRLLRTICDWDVDEFGGLSYLTPEGHDSVFDQVRAQMGLKKKSEVVEESKEVSESSQGGFGNMVAAGLATMAAAGAMHALTKGRVSSVKKAAEVTA